MIARLRSGHGPEYYIEGPTTLKALVMAYEIGKHNTIMTLGPAIWPDGTQPGRSDSLVMEACNMFTSSHTN